jgi:hypothetical protein
MHLPGDFTGALGETLTCAALPSGQAAYNLVSGDWSAPLQRVRRSSVSGWLSSESANTW